VAAPTRRLWCACTIIDYLKGAERASPDCPQIIEQAERGETEIVVSALAEAEVVKLDADDDQAEEKIREFFARPYVIRVALDIRVAETAREIARKYALKPLDAVHVASALRANVPVLETYDETMIVRVDGREGSPPLRVRHPAYEGQMRLAVD
jgi:predicted nucleic acid-binding protein